MSQGDAGRRRVAGPRRRDRPGHRPPGVRRRHPSRARAARQARDARLRAGADRRHRYERGARRPGRPPGHQRGRPAAADAAVRPPVPGPAGDRRRRDALPRRTGRGDRRRDARRRRGGRPPRPDRLRGAAGGRHDRGAPSTRTRRSSRTRRSGRATRSRPPTSCASTTTAGATSTRPRPTSSSRGPTRSRWSPSSRSSRTRSSPPRMATGSPSGARSSTRTGCSASSPGVLDLPLSKVRIFAPDPGGGFGGKQHAKYEPLVAFMALRAGRPVRLVLTLEETFQAVRRGASEIRVRTGFRDDGTLVFRDIEADYLIGAYADIADRTVAKGSYTSGGPYLVPAMRIVARSVLSHTTPSTAFRGFGNPQQIWAVESNMDEAARDARHRPARAPAPEPRQARRRVHPGRHARRRRLGA